MNFNKHLQSMPLYQKGFTLLEMVLVLFLISLMASATLFLTENVEDQAKYDETKRRMDIIRQAIVGDPTRKLNGQTEISGFAADMGRLPLCLAELLELGDEKSPVTDPKTYESVCNNAITITVWHTDSSTGISSGWRGPYIQVTPENSGELRFRDGYSNPDVSGAENSGWKTYTVSNSTINLESEGFDIQPSDDISSNQLVVSSDWEITSIPVRFTNLNASDARPSTDVNLNLRVYTDSTNNFLSGDDGATSALTVSASSAISAGGSRSFTFLFDSSTAIPTGNRAYTIVCHETPSGPSTNYVLFDGDCDPTNSVPTNNDIYTFFVAPRQNSTLDWTIQ